MPVHRPEMLIGAVPAGTSSAAFPTFRPKREGQNAAPDLSACLAAVGLAETLQR
jgi:hypothetical protein